MDVIIERACGMDVHKDSITACVMTPEGKEMERLDEGILEHRLCETWEG